MRKFFYTSILLITTLMASCSGDDYVNVIPADSIALLAVDMNNIRKPEFTMPPKAEQLPFIADMFGIDLQAPVYAFETKDGNIGVCAKVDDADDVQKCVDEVLVGQNVCKPLTPRKDFLFTVINDSWMLGLSDDALLIMGPAVPAAQPQLQLQMAKYLAADKKRGVKESPLYSRLENLDAPVRLVAQAQALPEIVAAPLTLGAPKEADESQVLIAAEITADGECLMVRSNTFSLNARIDAAIKANIAALRPVGDSFINAVAGDDAAAVFVNAEGTKFLELIQANKTLQLMLAGVNTAVDMDNIIRSVDGDAALVISDSQKGRMAMAAHLARIDFLDDVGYWQKSAPKGMSIVSQGKNVYRVEGADSRFVFGVTDDRLFYAGSDTMATRLLRPAQMPMAQQVQQRLQRQRIAAVVNLRSMLGQQAEWVMSFIRPLFGDPRYVIYTNLTSDNS